MDILDSCKKTSRDTDTCFFKAKLFDMQCFGNVSLVYILLRLRRILDEKYTLGS